MPGLRTFAHTYLDDVHVLEAKQFEAEVDALQSFPRWEVEHSLGGGFVPSHFCADVVRLSGYTF